MPVTSGAGVFSFTATVVVAPRQTSKRRPHIFTINQPPFSGVKLLSCLRPVSGKLDNHPNDTHVCAQAHELCIQTRCHSRHMRRAANIESGNHVSAYSSHRAQTVSYRTSSIPCCPSSCTRCSQVSPSVSRSWQDQNLNWVNVSPE